MVSLSPGRNDPASFLHRLTTHGLEGRQRFERSVRTLEQRRGELDEVALHARRRLIVEKIRAVFEIADAARRDRQIERQIELGRARVHEIQRRDGQCLERERPGRSLRQAEVHLEHRVAAAIPRRVHELHDLVERHLLVPVGTERHLADRGQHFIECLRAREPRPERQGVDEKPDQRLQLRLTATRDRRTEHEIELIRAGCQKHVERRQERHEQRAFRADAGARRAVDERLRQHEQMLPPVVRRHRGTPPIDRLVEPGRRALELTAPIRFEPLQVLPRERCALPRGEVGVLNRQIARQFDRITGKVHVEPFELIVEDAPRARIPGDVMADEQQEMLFRTEGDEQRAQHQVAREIEWTACLLLDDRLGFGPAGRCRTARQIHARHHRRPGRADHLRRLAVDDSERRAQDLVPPHDLLERTRERVRVERPEQMHGARDVVGSRARLQLLQEPQALLTERQHAVRPGRPARNTRLPRRRRRLPEPFRELAALLGREIANPGIERHVSHPSRTARSRAAIALRSRKGFRRSPESGRSRDPK